MKQQCESCRFFRFISGHRDVGICRHHAPHKTNDSGISFPIVLKGEWCGDWKAEAPESEERTEKCN